MTELREPAAGPTGGGPGATAPVIPPTAAPDAPDTTSWGGRHAHDPTVARDDDGVYWCFSTDARYDGPVRAGVQVRRSTDLVTWELTGWALPGVPPAAAAWASAEGLWAPEVVRSPDGGWRMYYSASSFGSRRSAIGLATAPHPAGPWTDAGLVVSSRHHEPPEGTGHPNAIDAAVVDDDDAQWLVYGSFFGGIHALPLDPVTGLVAERAAASAAPGALTDHPGVLLARRSPAVDNGAVEGAFVLPRPGGGWALLVSYDSLASSYHVRAAVADAVTGPYRDRTGRLMTDTDAAPWSVGVPVLSGHRHDGGPGVLAPGHGSVLTEDLPDGGRRQTFVHHVRDADAPARHRLQVRRLVWTHDGWPLVSPQPWAGAARETDDEDAWPSDPAVLDGRWESWEPGADPTHVRTTTTGVLEPRDEVRSHGRGRFGWRAPDGAEVSAVVHPGWDAVRGRATLVLTALDATGRVVLATRVDEGA
ncbi:arabinan endo-1,5-alpha-L-arabinosidase [Isoptericola dokdonensis]|uniref:Extracellular endo-alpha-(1->5)-L-arabinanase n=1 Tax=Isoptericola dokdonensis DS-3 TaxID=1300344 RepID=A0A168F871_9MICO|nr:arabinan endo-1,5-alpha-L-arabinosidase [Isoptericola dokdonensis]ANC31011.1 Extracellular endo-alpha-(1->5)-L-arabinanase precursor [Isoptericola dokdonensis DS-3]